MSEELISRNKAIAKIEERMDKVEEAKKEGYEEYLLGMNCAIQILRGLEVDCDIDKVLEKIKIEQEADLQMGYLLAAHELDKASEIVKTGGMKEWVI